MEVSQAEDKSEETGIYIVMENNVKSPREKYKRKAIKILSILHLVSGSLAISALGAWRLALGLIFESGDRRFYAPVGEGLICGFMLLVTGVIGITSIKWTTYCTIIAFLVLNILNSLSGFILTIMSLAIIDWSFYEDFTTGIVCNCLLIICGLFELLLGTVSSSFSCHACCGCCGGDSRPAAGANSVVYVPSQEDQGDSINPRVIHLNMVQLEKKSGTGTEEENEDKQEKNWKGYSKIS